MQSVFSSILDSACEGIIVINKQGVIEFFNEMAKDIFGINLSSNHFHPSGELKEGDLVIIVDSGLGYDDGGLLENDLKCLGLDEINYHVGSPFCLIGAYKKKSFKPIFNMEQQDKKISIHENINRHFITAELDIPAKMAKIGVDDKFYTMSYVKSVGHMVILDAEMNVKFFQDRGYTARREDIKHLLNLGHFREKTALKTQHDLIGTSIDDIIPIESNIDMIDFIDAARGKNIRFEREIKEINGRLTRCSLKPLEEANQHFGAVLYVEDITQLDMITKERDHALATLNEMHKGPDDLLLEKKIIGQSHGILSLRKLIKKAADNDSTVLLLGESGTGKGLVAETIHELGHRKNGPFVYVNCASIPEALFESELFGYVGGAFTGSKKEGKRGLFQAADHGILFLDEIGDMPLSMQVKLLHALQSRMVTPVGGTTPQNFDIKIITATNHQIEQIIEMGKFRKDLYYRINVFPIMIQPLRERKEDLFPLIKEMLPIICKRGKYDEKSISQEAMQHLYQYNWPGNIRELENIIERAVNMSEGSIIYKDHLRLSIKHIDENQVMLGSLDEIVTRAEKMAIQSALKEFDGDLKQVMLHLDIKKSSLYEKIKKHHLK